MPKTVKMMSEMNTTMMEVERVDRVGDRLMITGTMMGNFPAEIYVDPEGLLGLLAMHLRASPLSFVVGLPFFYLRCGMAAGESTSLAARAKTAGVAAAMGLGGIVLVLAVLLGVIDLIRIIAG